MFTSDNETETTNEPVETFSSFDGQIVEGLDYIRLADDLDPTEVDDIPGSGSVAYEGVAGFAYDEAPGGNAANYEIMADVSLEADFDDGDVIGTFDNFNTVDDVQLDGSLTVTEGEISDQVVTGNAIGDFVDGDDAVIWNLDIVGEFYGDEGEYIYGLANGTADNGGSEVTDVFGEFAVGQD
ncbi:hypothetical protein JQU17_15425 [Ponticoccus sp. SC2-23]|uniref:transferrin-binding protein-like solute binding protein n=1 Tax=Alexandriicola marinus TaxID=2081710 RepID=UPI000FDB98F2|nr:transferrin-binding protein-like solute binding protein [Alexandriicola marinus]MBM1221734.1 hypothetical protein [Ponticoccus sp. SC6-9]MBM1226085.1 hypothetical protein [Ponticoccus sp. SC6-15]MBM1230682.1 hypothetical protein [Ponticoccus sp. SC6-38]MBM1235478.1 hypothetical protein [Ponticoccus sp. SC6-45]MBM1239703.1 hypothetical protein [Ponticoccus sp. SC6-49]MBM1243847.1 hypothetical protein [Ponticoccus sp. SC2-64]MBM1249001.1 hypothetical protein [Ponticoccus sp. SC6-42]MBM1253